MSTRELETTVHLHDEVDSVDDDNLGNLASRLVQDEVKMVLCKQQQLASEETSLAIMKCKPLTVDYAKDPKHWD